MPKPRADSKLLNLPPEDHEWLVALLFTPGMSYDRVRPLVRARLGFSTSSAALSGFWEQCCAPRLLQRRGQAATAAAAIAAEVARNGERFDVATLALLKQKAFEIMASEQADPEELRALMSLMLKSRDQDQKERLLEQNDRRITLLESKLREVEAAVNEAKQPGGLTPEALARIEEAAKIL